MGRIKSKMIRGAATELFGSVEGFTTDFSHNKKLLKDTMPSKSVRNKMAGQLAKLSKLKEKKQKKQQEREKPVEVQDDQQYA